MDNKIEGLEVLEELLNKWKDSEINYYKKLKFEYNGKLNQLIEYKKTYGEELIRTGYEMKDNGEMWGTFNWPREAVHLRNYLVNDTFFIEKKLKPIVKKLIKFYNMDEIINNIEKEVEAQYKTFINKIESKGGEIEKVIYCKWSVSGNIDGLIKCKDKIISISTIIAGGYNVQRLHYRTLINVNKTKLEDAV
jgi:hypothetical protein